jgi:hypothetical protein
MMIGCNFFRVLMLLGSSVILWVNLIFRVHQSRQRLVWSSRVVLKWYYDQTASLVCDCHLFITRKGKMVFEHLFSATRRTQNALLGFTSAARYMWSQERVMHWCELAKWDNIETASNEPFWQQWGHMWNLMQEQPLYRILQYIRRLVWLAWWA